MILKELIPLTQQQSQIGHEPVSQFIQHLTTDTLIQTLWDLPYGLKVGRNVIEE
jgi:hypothetical protein